MASPLQNCISNFEKLTKRRVNYLLANKEFLSNLEVQTKALYDFSNKEQKFQSNNSLPTLIIKDFDIEQIWQQIHLHNEVVIDNCIEDVSRLVLNKHQLSFSLSKPDEVENNSEESESAKISESDEAEDLHISENSEDEEDEKTNNTTNDSNKAKKGSVVDDEFFKLNEMEAFLNKEESKGDKAGNDSDSENEDQQSIDMFENEDGQDLEDEENDARMAKFKDYFVSKDEPDKKRKREILDTLNDDENEHKKSSKFEKRQHVLKKQIEKIEDQAVKEKPWQLKGEITAESRPQNSLLEEIVEFDLTSRPAPVITEQTSLQLEDIIRQRIKDKVFDSVERKQKPVESLLEYKKRLVLDQEKSKQSLAQIYENEFLEKQAELDPNSAKKEEEEPELYKEVKKLMSSLFHKLDALSNYHFTSKPSIPELKVISNLPAIRMEDVAPVAMSDAALLAPEEVCNKVKGDIIGNTERTKSDKKRQRRKKKQKQKIHSQLKQKKENSKKIVDGVRRKYGVKQTKSKKK